MIKAARSKGPGKAAYKAQAHGDAPPQATGAADAASGDFGGEVGQVGLSGCTSAGRLAVPAAVRLPSKARETAEKTTRAYDAISSRHASARPDLTKRPPHPLAAV